MEIRRAKEKKWREYVENADDKSIFEIQRYITNTPTQTMIPTLNDRAATHEEKIATLQASFFPLPPPADLTDISQKTAHPSEVPFSSRITMQQVCRLLFGLAAS